MPNLSKSTIFWIMVGFAYIACPFNYWQLYHMPITDESIIAGRQIR
jgi:hypothetical protein